MENYHKVRTPTMLNPNNQVISKEGSKPRQVKSLSWKVYKIEIRMGPRHSQLYYAGKGEATTKIQEQVNESSLFQW